jgi:hypothetical protein
MVVTWLIVALITWPLIALAVGVLLGRGMAAPEWKEPRFSAPAWLRRELPPDIVAPLPAKREHSPI